MNQTRTSVVQAPNERSGETKKESTGLIHHTLVPIDPVLLPLGTFLNPLHHCLPLTGRNE